MALRPLHVRRPRLPVLPAFDADIIGAADRHADESAIVAAPPIPWPKTDRPLRILEVCNDFPPTIGGSETHNTSEVDFLCRRGHSVCVLVVRDLKALSGQQVDDETWRLLRRRRWTWSDEHQVPVYEAEDVRRRFQMNLMGHYMRLSRQHGPFDVVVVHRAHFVPGFAMARRLVLTLHYMELACPNHLDAPLCSLQPGNRCGCYTKRTLWQNLKWRLRQRMSYRIIDAAVTKYPHIASKLLSSGLSPSKVQYVPNWIDTSCFGDHRRGWPGMPETLQAWTERASFVFGFLGRLHEGHGPRQAIEAFARVGAREPGARLLVVGDGPERSSLERRIAEAGLADRAFFLGSVARGHVPAVLSWMDAGLATSTYDNYGWRTLEMMAAGLPVVVTHTRDIEHLVPDKLTGVVCGPEPEKIAAAMMNLASDREAAQSIGRNARKYIERRFPQANLLDYEACLYPSQSSDVGHTPVQGAAVPPQAVPAVPRTAPSSRPGEPSSFGLAARPLRILEVCNDFPPTVGGSETHNTSEVDFLRRRGHSVCVLALRDLPALKQQHYGEDVWGLLRRPSWTWSDEHQVPVYEAADPGRARVWAMAGVFRRLSRLHGPFDVVVVHRSHFLPAFAMARRLVLTLHYMELACPNEINPARCRLKPDGHCDCHSRRKVWRNLKWKLRQRLSGWLADAVMTKYPHIAEKLAFAGFPAAKIHCVPNWIDASSFGGRRREWPGMPFDFPSWVDAGETLFMYLGRLDIFHRPMVALDGFARIAGDQPGARLAFIGDGARADALAQRVEALGLQERVRFLGRLQREHVPAALSWGDAGLATSDQDNYCWSLLEMMAAGLPVIATDVGGTRHVIEDGRNGLLAPATEDGIAGAMRRILELPQQMKQVGSQARADVERRFSPENLLRYESILCGPGEDK